jgi:hypothetical protein
MFVVEADPDSDLIDATGQIQLALVAAGESDPQVEIYPTGADLANYQRFARASGQLLWARTPDPGVRIAVLFDLVDPTLGPRFREDHPTVAGEERAPSRRVSPAGGGTPGHHWKAGRRSRTGPR